MGQYQVRHSWILHLPQIVMDAFKGKFDRTTEEKYEDLLKLLNVGYLLRKAATVSNPVVDITECAGVWTITSSTTLKSMELRFKLNEEFDETTADGRDVKTLVTFEDNKIVAMQKAKNSKHKNTKLVYEIVASGELVHTVTVPGETLVCVQKFKRVA